MNKISNWKKVIKITIKISNKTNKFVPMRGYSANEISSYLLSNFNSLLTEEDKKILKSVLSS